MTHLRKQLLILATAACVLGAAQTAAAGVQPAGTGEPLYTNSAQNTQWFEWPATSGIGGYRVQYSYYENSALVDNPTYPAPNGASNVWANWSGVRTLQHGGQYGICAQGAYTFPSDSLWISDGPNSCSMGTALGRRASTTIDRSKPSAAITLAGGAAATNDPKVALQVAFSDDVAGPFPANFLCFQFGGTSNICDSGAGFIYGYTSACSVPAGGGKSTTFTCTADVGAGASPAPDGPVWACVIAADASIPDNPSGPNQAQSAEKANLSDAKCDNVTLDRTAPSIAIDGPSAAKVGELVSFGAQAADATSGLAGGLGWTFGDNTAGATGGTVSHTFTQAGTYAVQVKASDGAGNQGTATKVITVSAPSTGGGATGGGSTGDPAADDPAAGDPPAFELSTPRKLKARAKALRLRFRTDAAGRVGVTLIRSGRVLARGSKAIGEGTTAYRLKLPRKAKAGRYTLKVTFTPGGGKATTRSRKLTLGKAAKASAAAASHGARVSGAGAPVGLPNGVFHGRRTRSFAPPGRTA